MLNQDRISLDSKEQACYSSPISSNIFSYTEQTEGSVNINSNLQRITFKNPIKQFLAYLGAGIQVLKNSYAPYIYFSENLVVQFSSTEVIFPFHNFW